MMLVLSWLGDGWHCTGIEMAGIESWGLPWDGDDVAMTGDDCGR